jgi:DNA gyrase subunit B
MRWMARADPGGGARAHRGDALGELARRYLVAEAVIERLARIIDTDALRCILEGCADRPVVRSRVGGVSADKLALAMAGYIRRPATSPRRRRCMPGSTTSTRSGCWSSSASTTATCKVSVIDADFLLSADYRALADCAQMVAGLIGEGAEIRRGDGDKARSQPVATSAPHCAGCWPKPSAASAASATRAWAR